MSPPLNYFDEILDDLEIFDNELDKLEYYIELGQELEPKDESLLKEENRVPGCVSNVYIDVELDEKGKLILKARSDAMVVAGYLRILQKALKNLDKEAFQKEARERTEKFIKKSGIQEHLTATRSNALGSIFTLIEKKVARLK